MYNNNSDSLNDTRLEKCIVLKVEGGREYHRDITGTQLGSKAPWKGDSFVFEELGSQSPETQERVQRRGS